MSVLKTIFQSLTLAAVVGTLSNPAKAEDWMQTDQAVPPPLGFVTFCAQNLALCKVKYQQARQMMMDGQRWAELQQVQTEINQAIVAQTDLESTGKTEQWSYAESGYGDCEDYALRKKKALELRGWPSEALLLTTAITEKGERHVVLTVVTSKGDYILDNRHAQPKAWSQLAYNWLARQDPVNPLVWRKATGFPESRLASLR